MLHEACLLLVCKHTNVKRCGDSCGAGSTGLAMAQQHADSTGADLDSAIGVVLEQIAAT